MHSFLIICTFHDNFVVMEFSFNISYLSAIFKLSIPMLSLFLENKFNLFFGLFVWQAERWSGKSAIPYFTHQMITAARTGPGCSQETGASSWSPCVCKDPSTATITVCCFPRHMSRKIDQNQRVGKSETSAAVWDAHKAGGSLAHCAAMSTHLCLFDTVWQLSWFSSFTHWSPEDSKNSAFSNLLLASTWSFCFFTQITHPHIVFGYKILAIHHLIPNWGWKQAEFPLENEKFKLSLPLVHFPDVCNKLEGTRMKS